jgi:hypothetical protein
MGTMVALVCSALVFSLVAFFLSVVMFFQKTRDVELRDALVDQGIFRGWSSYYPADDSFKEPYNFNRLVTKSHVDNHVNRQIKRLRNKTKMLANELGYELEIEEDCTKQLKSLEQEDS